MSAEFNPNSNDAQFATIIARLNNQDENVKHRHEENAQQFSKQQVFLDAILAQATRTNGRVTKLETKVEAREARTQSRWRNLAGIYAGVAGAVFVVWEVLKFVLPLLLH